MSIVVKIFSYIDRIEEKKLYQYIGILLLCIIFMCSSVIFYYYRSTRTLQKKIRVINELREEVKMILNKAQEVQQQRAEVDAMLTQDPNFKIGGYFKDLLEKLGLTNLSKRYTTEPVERTDNYRETRLSAEFVDMTMRELAELLQSLEENPRIYTKDLEVTKSKKTPKTIDVKLVIGTLQPKTAEGE